MQKIDRRLEIINTKWVYNINNLANEFFMWSNLKKKKNKTNEKFWMINLIWCHLTLILSLKSNIEGNQLQYTGHQLNIIKNLNKFSYW